MRYPIEHYDQHGFLKAPIWLWLGWLFLAKAWLLFVVAGASRDSGNQILLYIYPDNRLFYSGLVMGLPALCLMWLIGLRKPERRWANRLVSLGRMITLVTVLGQMLQVLYQIGLHHGAFSWPNALSLLLLGWFVLYLVKSKTVRDCLKAPPAE
ncbi:DUF2919 domain-containing protein [Vibrio sp.]|uniref:DUF2919 domain-containing protein n=1 Tax=Vibrio sp. TaxID=678 RepID=UPI003D149A13